MPRREGSRLSASPVLGMLFAAWALMGCAQDAPRSPEADGADTALGPGGLQLRKVAGDLVVRQPGSRVEAVDVEGQIRVEADDVTVRHARVRCLGVNSWCVETTPGIRNFVLERSEVGTEDLSAALGATGVLLAAGAEVTRPHTVRSVHIHDVVDGVRVDGPALIEDSRISDLHMHPGSHGDGIQVTGGTQVQILRNDIEGGLNCPVFLSQEAGSPAVVDPVVADNSLRGASNQEGRSSRPIGVGGGVRGLRLHGNTVQGPFENEALPEGGPRPDAPSPSPSR